MFIVTEYAALRHKCALISKLGKLNVMLEKEFIMATRVTSLVMPNGDPLDRFSITLTAMMKCLLFSRVNVVMAINV